MTNLTSKEKYRDLCRREKSIWIFLQDWWLDAVCKEQFWDVVLVERGGSIVACFPYYLTQKFGFKMVIKPKLTPFMGPWIRYPDGQKMTTQLSYEKSIVNELICQLPKFDFFYQDFHYTFVNWLPFYWKGFQQTTLYTYILEDLTNVEAVFRNFRNNIKREIRKAEETLTVYMSDDLEQFYHINQKTFQRQNITVPYSLSFLKRIDQACRERSCRKIFFAKDEMGRIHSAAYIVWDHQSAYFLMGGSVPELRTSGAASLIMWEAIKLTSSISRQFNFEGGLIESVERVFRSFGAKQVPYHRITKSNSLLFKIAKFILSEMGVERRLRLKAE